ncbi:MAG TPA: lytic transglycosylase domain-containing protein [bacterium]|nr:lytic transglycosylase domain-containing protein [bacterium]
MRTSFFLFILTVVGPLVAAVPDCLNKEPVTEQCLNEAYEAGEEESYLEFFPRVSFREKEAANTRRVLALYRTGREADIPVALKQLPDKRRRTLLMQYLSFRAAFSTKRWKDAMITLQKIAVEHPAFYRERRLRCLEGDMLLAQRKWNDAASRYDACLRDGKNESAAFSRLIAKEKGKGPDEALLADYLAFLEEKEHTAQRQQVRDRLLALRRSKGIPTEGTPLFSRWFSILRREGLADEFYCEQITGMGYPVSLEAARYLMDKKRYADAITVMDREIAKCGTDECRYAYGWEKFRILSWKGAPAEAGNYLIWLANTLSGQRRERALFHAAVSLIEAFDTGTARPLLEETVFKNPQSPFFYQSLYRLGLIYLMEGKEFFAYLLWGNYLFAPQKVKKKGFNAGDAIATMESLTLFYDRLHNYYLFSGANDRECALPEEGDCSVKEFISYYDFLYYHLGDTGKLTREKTPAFSNDQRRSRWRESIRSFDDDPYERLVTAAEKAPIDIRSGELVENLSFYGRHRILDGLLFYERYARSILSPPGGRKGATGDPAAHFVMSDLALPIYWAAEKHARIIDSIYDAIKDSLRFAPQYGDTENWKILYPVPHIDAVLRLSEEFALSPALIYAIMRAESFYRDWVVSGAGAIGLMQIMPSTFQKIALQGGIKVNDPYNPYESLKAGVWYISKLLRRFDGNIALAVASYNAGPKRVSQWYSQFGTLPAMSFIELIPYYETRNYVKRVIRFYEIYSYLYEGNFYHLDLGVPFGVKEDPAVVDF